MVGQRKIRVNVGRKGDDRQGSKIDKRGRINEMEGVMERGREGEGRHMEDKRDSGEGDGYDEGRKRRTETTATTVNRCSER